MLPRVTVADHPCRIHRPEYWIAEAEYPRSQVPIWVFANEMQTHCSFVPRSEAE